MYASTGEVGQGTTLEFQDAVGAPGVWNKVTLLTEVVPPKKENKTWDATHLESGPDEEERPAMGQPGKFTLKTQWIDDAVQGLLVTHQAAKTDLMWRATLPAAIGTVISWSGALTSYGVDSVNAKGELIASGGGTARSIVYT